MAIVLPSWLPQTLLIKIGIYAAIGLSLFVWWRAREARIAEENYVAGMKGGVVKLEQKMDAQYEDIMSQNQAMQEEAKADRIKAAEQTALVNAKIDVALTRLSKLTSVTLTMDERQKNYVEAHNIPPDKLDAALLEITRQIRELESQQPEPVP